MKKNYILCLLIIVILTGCESKKNYQFDNNDNNQIIDTDLEKDEIQSGDNDNNFINDDVDNTGGNNNSLNADSNNINNNLGNNNDLGKFDNNEADDNSNNLGNTDTDDVVKVLDATITYSCDTMFDYKLENDQCIRTEIVEGFDVSYSCPDGYVYNSGKCYIKKAPNEVKYCENSLAKMEGDFCVEGTSYEAYTSSSYGWPPTFNPNGGGPKKIYSEESYINVANINCPENSTKKTDSSTQKSYCLDIDGMIVAPLKATCPRNTEILKSENNNYYCVGIHYRYYYCWGEGTKLVGTTCTPGKPVSYGMYCDDNSQIVNGYCQYETNVKPISSVKCPGNSTPVSGSDNLCIFDWSTNAIITYSCPNNYILTYDHKCKLN